MAEGFISLHRDIQKHWIYQEKRKFSKYEAWLDILMMVNHSDNKTLIDDELILVKRGQRITSERKLAENWDWSRTKVRNFLDLLQKDEMIKVEKRTGKNTMIEVLNYHRYQYSKDKEENKKTGLKTSEEPVKDQSKTSGEPLEDINNNDNNDFNVNNDNKNYYHNDPLVQFYENNFGQISGTFADDINFYSSKGFDDEMILEAMHRSVEQGSSTWYYTTRILGNWIKQKVKSMEDVKRLDEKFNQSKGGYKGNGSSRGSYQGDPEELKPKNTVGKTVEQLMREMQ